MTYIYIIVLSSFIITVIILMNSIYAKYKESYVLNKASENISDGYLIFTSNGKITNYNKKILNVFKIKKSDIKNKSIYDLINVKEFKKEDIEKITQSCKKISNSNEIIKFDIRNKKEDKIYKIEIKSIVNNDIFLRYVIICKDVTSTYQVIEELHNNQEMMANREKFTVLGQLISRNSLFIKISNFCFIW